MAVTTGGEFIHHRQCSIGLGQVKRLITTAPASWGLPWSLKISPPKKVLYHVQLHHAQFFLKVLQRNSTVMGQSLRPLLCIQLWSRIYSASEDYDSTLKRSHKRGKLESKVSILNPTVWVIQVYRLLCHSKGAISYYHQHWFSTGPVRLAVPMQQHRTINVLLSGVACLPGGAV